MELLTNTKINFLGHRKKAVSLSILFIVISIVAMMMIRPNLGIDFSGGTQIQVMFKKDLSVAEIRSALGNDKTDEIQQLRDNQNEFLIRTENIGNSEETWKNMEAKFVSAFGENSFKQRSIEKVGPKIGSEMRTKAVKAVMWAMLLIMVYIAIRFEWRFAVGAVTALAHDVIFTLGIFTLFGLEINLAIVAAFMTIVGYSLNDTIVVFDRVRENLGDTSRTKGYIEKFNTSLNETLNRTIVTSLTTLFVVVTLFIAGGDTLRNFSLAMIIGVVVGTYSSLFVASPTVIYLHNRFPKNA